MGKLIRGITSDGAAMITVVDTTDIVEKAAHIHDTTAVVTAGLGRLLTAASMMGNMLKAEDNSLTLRVKADGPTGALVAVSDYNGNVRGYCENPHVTIPLKPNGKLDVSGAVGKNGYLYVLKDVGMKEPYNGVVPLVSGEIAEDITSYYAVSEQIPTVCALGVLVNRDRTVACSGGFIVQLLPAADDKTIDMVEKNIEKLKPITAMLAEGMRLDDIAYTVLDGFDVDILFIQDIYYKCNCSKLRVKNALNTLSTAELEDMADTMPEIEMSCHFCNKKYSFTPRQIAEMVEERKKHDKA